MFHSFAHLRDSELCETVQTNQITSERLALDRAFAARKRRKLDNASEHRASTEPDTPCPSMDTQSYPRGAPAGEVLTILDGPEVKNGESLAQLRRMVIDEVEHTAHQKQYVQYASLHPFISNIVRLSLYLSRSFVPIHRSL